MTREQARTYLKCSGMSEEQIDTVEKAFTSVTPTERTGHWIRQDNTKKPLFAWYLCSECGSYIGDNTAKYCSNCGAKMEGKA